MGTVRVTHLGADRYKLETRGHVVLTDQRRADAVEVGPTPAELLVMAVAGGAAHDAARYLRERGLPHEVLRVDCGWVGEEDPVRVGRIELSFTPSIRLRPDDYEGMLAAVEAGMVHSTLRRSPAIEVVPTQTSAEPS